MHHTYSEDGYEYFLLKYMYKDTRIGGCHQCTHMRVTPKTKATLLVNVG